jgi:serpin B
VTLKLILSVLLLATACSDSLVGPPEVIEALPRALTADEVSILAGSNAFGFGLLREVDPNRPADEPNTILSPFSASMALGMALEGAEGETFSGMRDALGFAGMSREAISASYEGLLDLLLDLDPSVELKVANSAWAREGIPFETAFMEAVTAHFDAVVQELDFSDPGAKDVINAWVEENTGGHIEEIVKEISPLDILFLINAVYFRGDWTNQFDPSETAPAPFLLQDGSSVSVPTMSGTIEYAGSTWIEGGHQVLALPYGGRAFEMVLVLPGGDGTVGGLVQELDRTSWGEAMDRMGYGRVVVEMPKFELKWGGLLNQALQAMGMDAAFDPSRADLSRMTEVPGAFISRVRQKTYMKVDEEGTTAAAATSVAISLTSAPVTVTVDRPFLVAIRERLSGTILFLGAVRDPR